MSKPIFHDTATDLSVYNPALGRHALVDASTWQHIRPVVIEAMRPLAHLSAGSLRPFLTAAVKLAAWAYSFGYPLSVTTLFSPAMIEAYLDRLPDSSPLVAPQLWRLSLEWDLSPRDYAERAEVARLARKSPYSTQEIASLMLAARSQPSAHRRNTLFAIIALGAGCGLTRENVRLVSATDVHRHEVQLFVRSLAHCAWVRPEFIDVLEEVVHARPEGPLRGYTGVNNLTATAANWLAERHGVPVLSTDRLRASYVCHLLESRYSVSEVLALSGLRSLASLDGYLEFIDLGETFCPRTEANP